jgi:hypothetical protein
VGGAARIVLGLLYPRRLQMTYHAAGGGCRNRACQVRSWSLEGAGLGLETRFHYPHFSDPDFGFGVDPGRLRGYPLAHLAGA